MRRFSWSVHMAECCHKGPCKRVAGGTQEERCSASGFEDREREPLEVGKAKETDSPSSAFGRSPAQWSHLEF
jgi:hypothetical protein